MTVLRESGIGMTPEALKNLLSGKELHQTLDVKTLVVDLVRQMSQEELEVLFWEKLPDLSHDCVKGYLYMSRG
jgi:hypothetical protein